MLSEKVKISCRGDDRDCLISSAIIRRNGADVSEVIFTPVQGDSIEKGQELGKIICSDGSEKPIKINLTGKLISVNTSINLTAPSFTICNIQLCGHDDLIQTDFQHMHICSQCQEQVWVYRDQEAGVIVAKQLSDFVANKRQDYRDEDYQIQFCQIKINEIIQPMTTLFVAEHSAHDSDSDSDDDNAAKIDFKLNAIIYIKDINRNYNYDRSWILKYEKVICSHQVIDKTNTCTYCMQYLPNHSNQTYIGLDQKENKLQIGKEYAEYSKKLVHQELHSNQKLILVLDLDNTILHAVQAMRNASYDNQEGLQKDTFHEFHNKDNKYVIKFRPYMKEFLETVLPHYEIYIFTMAMFDYAKCICDYLKDTYKDILADYPQTFGADRIISREKFNSSNKDLSQILPNSEKIMVILDDRDDVWARYKQNLVTTLPYIYWWDGSESFNDQAFKSIEKIQISKYRFLNRNSKKPQVIPTKTKSSNTQATSAALEMLTPLLPLEEEEKNKSDKDEKSENGSTQDSKEKDNQQSQSTNDSDETISQITTISNQTDEGEDNKVNEKEIDEIEEKMEVEDVLGKQLTNGDSSSKDENDTEMKLNLQIEVELQKDDKLVTDEPTNPLSEENKTDNTQSSNELKKTKPTYPPVIELQEKKFRPKYMENILQKYNNEETWKNHSIFSYSLYVIKKIDNYFLFNAPLLVHLKNKYYEQQDEQQRDIRVMYQQYSSKIFLGVKIAISSIIKKEKNETAENNIVCKRFIRMGGQLIDRYSEGNEIDYLVIGHNPRKEKLKKAIDNNIPIISYKWIEYCWYNNYKLDTSIFEVNKTDYKLNKNDQQIQQELFENYKTLVQI